KALILARRDIGSDWRHHRPGIDRRGYRDARRPGAPLSTITDPYPQHGRTRTAHVRGLRQLCRRHVVVLIRSMRSAIYREVPDPVSFFPAIVLANPVTNSLARREHPSFCKALILARRDIGSDWRHHRTGIDWRGYRDARPPAPLSTITDPYP